VGAWLGYANFTDAVIEGGDWLAAYLDTSDWTRARVRDVRFRSAVLIDSRFDEATFVDCDFQFADFSRWVDGDLGRCHHTRFERCDFRGANFEGLRFNHTTFDRCRFHAMGGKPDFEGPCTLIEPNFSSRDDGYPDDPDIPALRDPDEVLRVWHSDDRR